MICCFHHSTCDRSGLVIACSKGTMIQNCISSRVENGDRVVLLVSGGEARQRALEVLDESILLGVSSRYSIRPLDLFA